MGLIYCATSPSGKHYIGQTINFTRRMYNHENNAYKKGKKKYNFPFPCAIRKYGFQTFVWTILEDNIPRELLNEKEILWIARYRNAGLPLYNISEGGGQLPSNFGRIASNEARLNMSKSSKGHTRITEQQRNQASKRAREKTGSKNVRARKIICLDTGKIYDTLGEASIDLQINKNHISSVCSGVRKSVGGYQFVYYSNDPNWKCPKLIDLNTPRIGSSASRRIICLDTGKIYPSMIKASQELGVCKANISQVCRGIAKTAGGYCFRYC